MEPIRELEPKKNSRQLRHTMVRGRDGKVYKILTFRLYDADPPPEFHRFEVNVQQVREDGTFQELIVPYFRRFYDEPDALRHHEELLERFDDTLELEEPPAHAKKKDEADSGH